MYKKKYNCLCGHKQRTIKRYGIGTEMECPRCKLKVFGYDEEDANNKWNKMIEDAIVKNNHYACYI